MSNRPTKVPSIPKVPSDTSPGLRHYLESLSEAVDIRLGRRGDKRDRAVTLRELVDSGIAVELKGTPFDPNQANQTFSTPTADLQNQVDQPTSPTGFSANGGYELISLFWDLPRYRGHSLTEVWRHTADVIGDAQLIGITGGTTFVDSVGESATFYYWIRHVNSLGFTGFFHSANGELAQTSANVDLLLGELADSITSSQLAPSLATTIGNLPADTQTEINSLQGQINTLSTVASWASGTTYALDDLVTYNGNLYRSKVNSNVGNQPSGNTSDTTYWEFVGTYSSLSAAVAGNTSDITQINFIDATSTSAIASQFSSLKTNVEDPNTGLSAAHADITQLNTVSSTSTSANASALATLQATVNDSTTGLAAAHADITQLNNVSATSTSATASTLASLQATVNDSTTGLAAAHADITQINFIDATSTSAIAVATNTLNTTVAGHTTSISQQATSINGLEAQYTVKIDNAGHVSGYGLASTAVDGTPTSEFGVRADQFWIAPPAIASNSAPTTNLFAGKVWVDTSGSEDVTKYYTGSAWSTTPQALPFVVQSSPTTLNGVTVPAGVYIDQAFIKNGSIVNAQIADATIDKGKIASLDADDITAGTMSADRLSIDNIGLDTAVINGVQSLILRDNGVFVDNLSIDSVGVVKFALNNSLVSTSMQQYTYENFTSATPFNEYDWSYYNPFDQIFESGTATLPEILSMTLSNGNANPLNDDLKESSSDYYIDFAAAIIGSASNSSSTSQSGLVLVVTRRSASSSGNYSHYQSFGTHSTRNGALPLVPIHHMVKVSLSKSYDYQIKLYGYSKGVAENNATTGFSSRRIRLFRIAKASA